MGATYLDDQGNNIPIVMGCYGIGIGRILAAVIERSHDTDGMIWPISIAPYQVHLVALRSEREEIGKTSERLVAELETAGIEVLWDDRGKMAGVKFKDADLMGMPIRLTVSPRNHERQMVEMRVRATGDTEEIPYEKVVAEVRKTIASMRTGLETSASQRRTHCDGIGV
jgi:prolyl-tRNA synthetase